MADRTPEQIGREAGKAIADSIADGLETVILKLTDALAAIQVEQAELRDEFLALAAEHRTLEGAYMAHLREHHGG
jgi:phage FluMu gp28-like protein